MWANFYFVLIIQKVVYAELILGASVCVSYTLIYIFINHWGEPLVSVYSYLLKLISFFKQQNLTSLSISTKVKSPLWGTVYPYSYSYAKPTGFSYSFNVLFLHSYFPFSKSRNAILSIKYLLGTKYCETLLEILPWTVL